MENQNVNVNEEKRELTLFSGLTKNVYCSKVANTEEEKKELFNALETCDVLLNDCVGTEFELKDIYVEEKEVIDEIHGAGGIAVLAHPGKFNNRDEIEDYVELGLDGVEVWSPENSDELTEELIALCKKKKLLQTGGSDFHGLYNEVPTHIGSNTTDKENLDKLFKLIHTNAQKSKAPKTAANV